MLVYFGIGIVLLLVLFIFFFRPIRLFLIRLLFSKYSFSYVKVFKKYFFKNPFVHCIKDSFEHHARHFYEEEKNAVSFKTTNDITFGKMPFNTTFQKVRKLKKKPYCFNSYKMGKYYIKVIGYKESLVNLGCNVVYYFIDNRFFLGEYVFKEPTEKTIGNIIKLVQQKYLEDKTVGLNKFYINHEDGSQIFYRNTGFAVILSYINLKATNLSEKFNEVFETIINKPPEEAEEDITISREENPF